MKKSKILMPLTGIAAIGAIAPVAVMTSCGNKNASNIFATIGFLEDKVGSDIVAAAASAGNKLPMVIEGTLNNPIAKDHKYFVSWSAKEVPGKVFYIAAQTPYEIKDDDVETFEEKSFVGEIEVLINPTNYATWKTKTESETFTLDVTYEEKSKDEKTTYGKQVVSFSFTAYPDKVSQPIVAPTNTFTGTVKDDNGTTELGGWTISKAVETGATLTVSYNSTDPLVLKDKTTADADVLTIAKSGSVAIDGTAISFGATTKDKDGAGVAKGFDETFTATKEVLGADYITVTLTFKATGDKYVRPEWTQDVVVTADSTFAVSRAS